MIKNKLHCFVNLVGENAQFYCVFVCFSGAIQTIYILLIEIHTTIRAIIHMQNLLIGGLHNIQYITCGPMEISEQ